MVKNVKIVICERFSRIQSSGEVEDVKNVKIVICEMYPRIQFSGGKNGNKLSFVNASLVSNLRARWKM